MKFFIRKLGLSSKSTADRRHLPFDICLAWLFLLAALGIVVACVLDYRINWMHPETFGWEHAMLSGLTGLRWIDWLQFFNCNLVSEGCTRPRFLSYLFSYLDAFYRLWLVQYLPPHPSLSLNWFLSVATLGIFYGLLVELTQDRFSALIGVSLYMLSAGFLSGVIFLFHPAKPLAAFFVILCLFLATKIWKVPKPGATSPYSITLYVCLLLAYCSDETTWVLPVAVILLCPNFLDKGNQRVMACVALTFPLFLVFVTWGAPIVIQRLFNQNFNFWSWALNLDMQSQSQSLFARISASVLWAEALNMIESQYSWWRSGPTIAATSLLPVAMVIGWAAFVVDEKKRKLLIRLFVVLLVFVLFQCLILLRHYTASGTFYYSNLFPVFSLLVVSVAISAVRHVRLARILSVCVAAYLGYVSFTWCMAFNRSWVVAHNRVYADTLKEGGSETWILMLRLPFQK